MKLNHRFVAFPSFKVYHKSKRRFYFTMDNTKMGELIRQARKAKGLTQKDVAEKLGITDRAVSKWERGVSQT